MSKKCYRFFGGLLNAQAKWLNKMSEKGYRLVRTGRVLYEFEECRPDEVTYCVEFIGEKSKENATDYADFLKDMGYKVFFKNINLNYSVGKVRLRPNIRTNIQPGAALLSMPCTQAFSTKVTSVSFGT